MATKWFYHSGKQIVGPISPRELRRQVRHGRVRPETPVQKGENGQWTRAARVRGLFPKVRAVVHSSAPEINPFQGQFERWSPPRGKWFYFDGTREVGPFTSAEMRQLARRCELGKNTYVKKGETSRWIRARRVKNLFPKPVPVAAPVSGDDAARKPAAGIGISALLAGLLTVLGVTGVGFILFLAVRTNLKNHENEVPTAAVSVPEPAAKPAPVSTPAAAAKPAPNTLVAKPATTPTPDLGENDDDLANPVDGPNASN